MQDVQSDSNVSNRRVLKTRKDTTTCQGARGGRRGGRVVQQQHAAVHLSGQMSEVSNAFRCNHQEEAKRASDIIRRTINIWTSKDPETKQQYELVRPTDEFANAAYAAVKRLCANKEMWKNHDVLSVCVAIVKEVHFLKRRNIDINSPDYQFMRTLMGPAYAVSFGMALENLMDQASAGSGWEHAKILNEMAQHFTLHPQELAYEFVNRNRLTHLCKQILGNEFRYMDYLKIYPLKFSVKCVCKQSKWLLSQGSAVRRMKFLSYESLNNDKRRVESLFRTLQSMMNNLDPVQKTKRYSELNRMLVNDTTDVHVKRQYIEILMEQLARMMKENEGVCASDQQSILFLEKVVSFCEQYRDCIDASYVLSQELEIFSSGIARLMLLAIRSNIDNTDKLKERLLELIGDLDKKIGLDEESKELYIRCTQAQVVTGGATAKPDEMTDAQCRKWLSNILWWSRICYSECGFLVIAENLKQLLEKHAATGMWENQQAVWEDINIIKKRVYINLFMDILHEFVTYKNEGNSLQEIGRKMSEYKTELIQLRRYVFIMKGYSSGIQPLADLAYCIWYDDIARMSKAIMFSENDLDQLLYLQDLIQDVTSRPAIRHALQDILTRLLQSVHHHDGGAALSAAKISKLREWAVHLNLCAGTVLKPDSAGLEVHRDSVSNDAVVSAVSTAMMPAMPAIAHPGIMMGVPVEASGCHLHMRQQITPCMMQPLTDLAGMPVPATQRSFQQPVSVPDGASMLPPLAADRSQPMPAQHIPRNLPCEACGDQPHFLTHTRARDYPPVCGYIRLPR